MANKNVSIIPRQLKAFGYSWQGIKAAYAGEQAFREEAFVLLVAIPLAFWLGDNALEYVLLIGSLLWVMTVELLNSAIEAVVDRFGGEIHELSGKAKDMGSAAVLLAIICTIALWLVILFN
ncbi:MAG: diacylglycerol kinase [Thiotrichaceae bacterium]|nr:diacylglycerol kinase [Thiotrichaceae bacterium]